MGEKYSSGTIDYSIIYIWCGVEELDPNLNPIQHFWDELEHQLRAGAYRLTSLSHLANALVAEWEQNPAAGFLKCCGKLSQKSGGCYSWVLE